MMGFNFWHFHITKPLQKTIQCTNQCLISVLDIFRFGTKYFDHSLIVNNFSCKYTTDSSIPHINPFLFAWVRFNKISSLTRALENHKAIQPSNSKIRCIIHAIFIIIQAFPIKHGISWLKLYTKKHHSRIPQISWPYCQARITLLKNVPISGKGTTLLQEGFDGERRKYLLH